MKFRLLLLLPSLFFLFSCSKFKQPRQFEYYSDLSGTSWVIKQYDNVLTNLSQFPNDTLYFVSDESYYINQGVEQYYRFKKRIRRRDSTTNDFNPYLKLHNCSTFGGTFEARVTRDLVATGELNNLLFISSGGNQVIAWMEQID